MDPAARWRRSGRAGALVQATRWTHVRQAQSSRARRTCAPLSRVRRMPRHIRPQIIYSTADSRGRRSGQLRAQPRVLLRFAACCKARVAKQNSKRALCFLCVCKYFLEYAVVWNGVFVCLVQHWCMRCFGFLQSSSAAQTYRRVSGQAFWWYPSISIA